MSASIHQFPNKVFVAHHTRLEACDCGCGTLKFLACDADDKVHAIISHGPDQWLEICQAIGGRCLEMLDGIPPESA